MSSSSQSLEGKLHVDIEKFKNDGYVVIENFVSNEDIDCLMKEYGQIIEELDPNTNKSVFSNINNPNFTDQYFISSSDKVRCFFEKDAFNEKGELIVDKYHAVNKIGHALHVLLPGFKRISTSQKVKDCANALGYLDPVIAQSMYICKQPSIGGKVQDHQDATYLFTTPFQALSGLWIALEDATLENGCLSFIPGSHKGGLRGDYRLIRTTKDDGLVELMYEGTKPEYNQDDFMPVPVKKGSAVLIDGLVVHKSEENKSKVSRHIYTFHVYDCAVCQWNERNWLQPTEETFLHLYDKM